MTTSTTPLTLGDPSADPFARPADQPEIVLGRGFATVADLLGACVAVIPSTLEEVDNGFFDPKAPVSEKNRPRVDRITADVIVFGRSEIVHEGNKLTAYAPNALGVIEISGMYIGQTTLVDQLRAYVGRGMFLGVLAKVGRAYQFNDPSRAQHTAAIAWWSARQDAAPV